MDYSAPGSSNRDFPGKNVGMGCHLLLQGIFPDQGSNPRLLHWQGDSHPLCHQGSPQQDFLRRRQLILKFTENGKESRITTAILKEEQS